MVVAILHAYILILFKVLAGDVQNAIKSHLVCQSVSYKHFTITDLLLYRLEPLATVLWHSGGFRPQYTSTIRLAISSPTWYCHPQRQDTSVITDYTLQNLLKVL